MKKLLYKTDEGLRFCPGKECPHYGKATKYPRKCYYEVQCWRGYLDILIDMITLRFRKHENYR